MRTAIVLGLVALGVAHGGFAPVTAGLATFAALGALAFAVVLSPAGRPSGREAVMLGALAALALWSATSATWSPEPAEALLDAQRLVLYSAVLALLALSRLAAASIADAVGAACAGVSALALAGAFVPGAGEEAARVVGVRPDGDALAGPLGYSNALGLVAAMGVLLCAGAAARARGPALAGAVVCVAVLVGTGSPGAGLALVAGVAIAVAVRAGGRGRGTHRPCRSPATAVLVAALLATTAVVAAGTGGIDRSVQVRSAYWEVSWQSAVTAPLTGEGAGSFAPAWRDRGAGRTAARRAHGLFTETLGEVGIVGLALLVAALGAPLAAARRLGAEPWVPYAAGAYGAFLVHASVDWHWDLPVVALAALACGAALLRAGRTEERPRPLRAPVRLAAAAAAVLLAAGVARQTAGTAALERARVTAEAGALADAGADARTAARLLPWSAEARRILRDVARWGASAVPPD